MALGQPVVALWWTVLIILLFLPVFVRYRLPQIDYGALLLTIGILAVAACGVLNIMN